MVGVPWWFVLAVGCARGPVGVAADPASRVIVVGAGMAGLTTARVLSAAGVEVVVVEARDRLGGRTWTASVGDARVDLGAAWLHGVVGNPVADFADAQGLTYVPDDLPWTTLYDEASGEALGDGAWERMDEAVEDFEGALPWLRRELGANATVAQGRTRWIADEELTGRDARLAAHAIDQWVVELEYAGPVDAMSLAWVWEEGELRGGDHFPVGGYGGYVEAMAEGLDVRLSKPVTAISQDADGVVVQAGGEEILGTHVVVTVPVGVLKAGTIAFEPPLSAARRAALDRLDTGNLEKVVLTFAERWWPGSLEFVDAQGDGTFPEFIDVTSLAGAPTLVGLYGGRYARAAQATRSDAELVSAAVATLQTAWGRSVPTPVATAVTHWTTDPFARGSYTFLPVGASRADIEALAEPEGSRVFFAGEGTYWEHYGNVHGAVLSGLREAHRLGVRRVAVDGLQGG
jgi:polyamine oxidase